MRGMKKMKNNLDELRSTLESIRAAKYPEIPAEVISAIIDVQNQNQNDPTRRQRETQKLIIQYSNQIKADGGDEQ